MVELKKGNCLELMNDIPDKSVDMVLCDLPYGSTACKWDVVIPFDILWKQYNRISKDNAAILLFGQEPFSSYLRLSNVKNYRYDLVWAKEAATNFMQMKKRFGKTTEYISVFYKSQPTYNPQMWEHKGKPVKNSYSENSKRFKSVVACNNNRDKNPLELYEYYEIAKQRIGEALEQKGKELV